MKIAPFNRLEILSSDLNFLQDNKDESIAQRVIDQFLIPGIVTPLGVIPSDMQDGLTNVANVPFLIAADSGDTATPTIKVGPDTLGADVHIAYDQLGNRIHIPLADDHYAAPVWNENAPALTTVGVTSNTPYSTGRRQVHVPKPGSGSTDYYIFASYVPVVRTVSIIDNPSYPPNHQTVNGATTITPSNDGNKPIEGIDELQGLAYAHHIIDGYRIFAGTTAGGQVTNTGPGQTPTLAANVFTGLTIAGPNEPDSAYAIFIGKVNVTSGGVITITQDGTRPLLRFKSVDSATLSTTTSIYAINQVVTLLEHVNARGTRGLGPTPNNPHDISAADVGAIFNTVAGLASKQTFVPLNANPNFETYPTPTGDVNLATWSHVDTLSTLNIVPITVAGELTNIQTLGPKVRTGAELTFSSVGSGVSVALKTLAYPLKPSTTYTVVGWVQAYNAGSIPDLALRLENSSSVNISGGSDTASGITINSTLQRFAVALTTSSTATIPQTASKLTLVFSSALTATYATLLLTNVMIVEGDWTLGNVAKKELAYKFNLPGISLTGANITQRYPLATDVGYSPGTIISNGQFANIVFTTTIGVHTVNGGITANGIITLNVNNQSVDLAQGGFLGIASYINGNLAFPCVTTWHGYLAPGTYVVGGFPGANVIAATFTMSGNDPASIYSMGLGELKVQLL